MSKTDMKIYTLMALDGTAASEISHGLKKAGGGSMQHGLINIAKTYY